ncbi:hypothetical protein ABZS76_20935 [Streptomyces sp. NPDC005562]|uniref:hypothetical protein n=1 Tax=Streptomyces sp. NPDC005562 TaxID=3154890 RepID=UPI0033A38DBC
MSRTSFSGTGSAFPEADGLYKQYDQVHERLTSLSKMLGEQIDAMGIAVHGADVGFDNLEEGLRQRFWEIQARIDRDQPPTGNERSGGPDVHGGHGSDKSNTGWS